MRPEAFLLALVLSLATTFAAEESCAGRCGTFNLLKKCQCDSLCLYYGSCCSDFDTACPKKIARGDTFEELGDIPTTATTADESLDNTTTTSAMPITSVPPTVIYASTPTPDPNAVPCSKRPFDAFLQLKNGSIYAFRGEYFFELDEKKIQPGYPKLIQDVWGISGPIDAAFTRINCQGKTYIFKGNQYWRFEDHVMDEDYPRDISVGFDNIPGDINAAFAVAAPSHNGKEKAYFFKGDQYYQYEFKHQPSHEECVQMTRSSPSVLFTQYTNLYCDQTWEDLFTDLFGAPLSERQKGPRPISRDWIGIRPPVDAAMVGRVFISPKPTVPPSRAPSLGRRRAGRRRRPSRRQSHRHRHSRSLGFEDFFFDEWLNDYDDIHIADYVVPTQDQTMAAQSVYFFKGDEYYRVDLGTKRVAFVHPPYPRSIAKYWLGQQCEESSDNSRAEK